MLEIHKPSNWKLENKKKKKEMSHKIDFVLDKICLSSWMIFLAVFKQTDEKNLW